MYQYVFDATVIRLLQGKITLSCGIKLYFILFCKQDDLNLILIIWFDFNNFCSDFKSYLRKRSNMEWNNTHMHLGKARILLSIDRWFDSYNFDFGTVTGNFAKLLESKSIFLHKGQHLSHNIFASKVLQITKLGEPNLVIPLSLPKRIKI